MRSSLENKNEILSCLVYPTAVNKMNSNTTTLQLIGFNIPIQCAPPLHLPQTQV
eukprot:m.60455 g.60455  ORF g.60455 m.60455 type:complete len:54 (-) comp7944_c1_seq1:742-903(-)